MNPYALPQRVARALQADPRGRLSVADFDTIAGQVWAAEREFLDPRRYQGLCFFMGDAEARGQDLMRVHGWQEALELFDHTIYNESISPAIRMHAVHCHEKACPQWVLGFRAWNFAMARKLGAAPGMCFAAAVVPHRAGVCHWESATDRVTWRVTHHHELHRELAFALAG